MVQDEDIMLSYAYLKGKRWVYNPKTPTLQCPYCLNLQPLKVIRENQEDRFSLAIAVRLDEETHVYGCPQEVRREL